MRTPLLLVLWFASASAGFAAGEAFGIFYPHTRWVAKHHRVRVDAFKDHLVIAQRGRPVVVVRGCWRGRAFLKDCQAVYFSVAHEGTEAGFASPSALAKLAFERVQPDPET
ncbi:MAG: hypothetical protein INR62_11505 [Rhodospirillales bacterium]|nr:hypothetical protein [Acetobacter sp.]